MLLSDPRVNPSANYNRSIRRASEYGHHETVRVLLADPRVNLPVIKNYSLQMMAMKSGQYKIVELLKNNRQEKMKKKLHSLAGFFSLQG